MFDQLVLSATMRKRSGRWLYFTGTAAAWMMALTTTIIGGIFAYDARLSGSMKDLIICVVPPPAVSPPPGGRRNDAKPTPKEGFVSAAKPPDGIKPVSEKPPVIPTVTGDYIGDHNGVPGGDPNGRPDGVVNGLPVDLTDGNKSIGPPPPPLNTKRAETAPPSKAQSIVRKVSTVLQGSATRRVQPVYPILARNARVSGQVVVEVTIDEEGNVIGARALSGHALLKQVSLDAAFGWKWRPTLLNGVPVKVIGTITFNFQL